MISWRTVSRKVILDRQPHLVVEERSVALPDGSVIDNWTWIDTPDFVIVVALDEQGKFIVLEQTKYAIKGPVILPVGGYFNPGEEPLEAAQREFLEETGYESPDWVFLGDFVTDSNRGNGRGYYFLARSAHKVAEIASDDLEEQHIRLVDRDQIEYLVAQGHVRALSGQAAFAMALLRLYYL
ncbi:MAG: NUDIX hydrolase [Anaerolineaceae bacterium]